MKNAVIFTVAVVAIIGAIAAQIMIGTPTAQLAMLG